MEIWQSCPASLWPHASLLNACTWVSGCERDFQVKVTQGSSSSKCCQSDSWSTAFQNGLRRGFFLHCVAFSSSHDGTPQSTNRGEAPAFFLVQFIDKDFKRLDMVVSVSYRGRMVLSHGVACSVTKGLLCARHGAGSSSCVISVLVLCSSVRAASCCGQLGKLRQRNMVSLSADHSQPVTRMDSVQTLWTAGLCCYFLFWLSGFVIACVGCLQMIVGLKEFSVTVSSSEFHPVKKHF